MNSLKIKRACDQILPTEQEKQQMLEQILYPKKKRGLKKFWITGSIFTTIVATTFIIIVSHQTPVKPSSMMRLSNINPIEYKGVCYEYIGLYPNKNLKRTKDQIMGGIVYQIKSRKDSIVIYQNGEYQHYQKCRGE